MGGFISRKRRVRFPRNVLYGDIVTGFHKYNSLCDAVYCSHVLEHLTYDEFVTAIQNTYALLREGGVFRLVMPDLQAICKSYIESQNYDDRAILFMRECGLGAENTRRGLVKRIEAALGNSRHNWLWDYDSTRTILRQVGFQSIRPCCYNDSDIEAFKVVEDVDRFRNAIAIEACRVV